MSHPVLVEHIGAVARITLNAPERLNAIDAEMGKALDAAFADTGSDPDVRAIIVTGAGRGFCAGASMGRLTDISRQGTQALTGGDPANGDPCFSMFEAPPELRTRYTVPMAIPKPVIAAINGPCAGAGFILALACDIRIGSNTAKFVANFAKLGLVAEGASAYLLPRIAGYGFACDMLLSGRSVDAEEALRVGLVSSVAQRHQFEQNTLDVAQSIAKSVSPASVRFIKQQLQHSLSSPAPDSIKLAYSGTQLSISSEDFSEGLRAYAQKRPPSFASLDFTLKSGPT